MNSDKIEVSVICLTYNHGLYVRDTLEGFVKQKTNFAFEVLLHDDASTDNTAEIVREYEKKYPNLIKPIYQTVNQYSQGIPISRTYNFPRAKGRYIAFCEGDDYWTDPYKLQKQFDAMEKHPELDICIHAVQNLNSQTGKMMGITALRSEDTIIPTEDVILGTDVFGDTNSFFYRKEIVKNPPNFLSFYPLDYSTRINGSLRGGTLYLKDCMSVYRKFVKSSWTMTVARNSEKIKKHRERRIKMLEILDEETKGKYHTAIEMVKLECACNYKEMLKPQYRDFYNRKPFDQRVKIKMKAYFPFLVGSKIKLRKLFSWLSRNEY